MEPKEIFAVPSGPSNLKYTTVHETGASWGLELVPRRAVVLCNRCHNHGIISQIMGQEHICPFQACQCHNCVFFSEHQKAFPAVTTPTREQGAQLKKHPALGLSKSMTIAPGVPVYINNMAMGAGIHTGKVNIIPQPQAYPCYISNEGALSGVLLFSQSSEPTFLPCTPVTTEPQLVFTISGQPQGPPILPATSSSFIVQPCATLDPLLQPQVPKASEQALVVASEWERRLEAAEALLALRDSIPTPPDPRPLAQPCSLPAGKVNIIPQPQAYPCYISNLETPPEGLLFIQPQEPTFLPCTPVTTGPQLVFAISGQPQRPLLPGTCSNLILQPCATVDTLQLQPQVPKASEQALVAASEWQQKLEAAKALLALRNSRPTSTDNLPQAQP